MKVLIDSKEHITQYGFILNSQNQPASYHKAILDFGNKGKNFKVITSGHVYVLNYDSETYVPKCPETIDEYMSMQKAGLSFTENKVQPKHFSEL